MIPASFDNQFGYIRGLLDSGDEVAKAQHAPAQLYAAKQMVTEVQRVLAEEQKQVKACQDHHLTNNTAHVHAETWVSLLFVTQVIT